MVELTGDNSNGSNSSALRELGPPKSKRTLPVGVWLAITILTAIATILLLILALVRSSPTLGALTVPCAGVFVHCVSGAGHYRRSARARRTDTVDAESTGRSDEPAE